MAKKLVSDELWEVDRAAATRRATQTQRRQRPRIDDRAALTGILFVLKSGIPWEMLPQEMGCGSLA
jgi:transposase